MPRNRMKTLPVTVPEYTPDLPYLEYWMSLTPRERLRRAWRLRKRLKNLQAIHDEKTFPEL